MSEKLISFCIPMHNSEKYISDCIKSIEFCTSDSDNYEILIYDDASTDNSISVVENLSKTNRNIKLINGNPNQGVSIARNSLINNATGEYIWFVDSDDMVSIKGIISLTEKMFRDSVDVCMFDFVKFFENDSSLKNQIEIYNEQHVKIVEPYNHFTPFCSRHIIKRKLITENNLQFDPYMWHSEDRLFTTELYLRINSYIRYYGNCYLYRQHNNSISHFKKSDENNIKFYEIHKHLADKIYSFQYDTDRKKIFLDFQKEQIKEILAMALVVIKDSKYVRKEFKYLKEYSYYPYNSNQDRLKVKSKIIRKYTIYYLNKPFIFWSFHFFNKLVKIK